MKLELLDHELTGRAARGIEAHIRCHYWPVAIALAASAAGTAAQMQGQAVARKESKQTARAEEKRQQDYQKKGTAKFEQSLAQADRGRADQNIEQAGQNRQALYRSVAPAGAGAQRTPVYAGRGTAANNAANQARSRALAGAWSRLVSPAQARLGGYGDWGLARSIENRRINEGLGVIGDAARGSSRVLNTEMQDAAHAGDGWQAAGMGLQMAGQVAGSYAATTPASGATADWGQYVGADGQPVNFDGSPVGTQTNPWSSVRPRGR